MNSLNINDEAIVRGYVEVGWAKFICLCLDNINVRKNYNNYNVQKTQK